ncbi:MAG: ABC transporter permease [Fimbriimonas sp.]
MARYWRIYRTFFVSSFARELEFRANFFAKVLQNVLWIFFFVAILFVVYRNTDSVAGWTRGDALILAATVFLMNAFANALFFSLSEIPSQVRMGTLDFVVTKPVDSQFWVSTRRFNFDQIGTLVAGVIMIAIGVSSAHLSPSPLQWLGYLTLVASALALFYAFNLALMTTGVWLVRVDNLWVLSESIVQVARYPLDIYGSGLQRLLTFAVPLGLLSTIPARQLVRGFDPSMVALGVGWAVASLLLSRAFWRFALRHYSSASS